MKRLASMFMNVLVIFCIGTLIILAASLLLDNIFVKKGSVTVNKNVMSEFNYDMDNSVVQQENINTDDIWDYDETGEYIQGASDRINIVCWGDSITYGQGGSEAVVNKDDEIIDISGWDYPTTLQYYTGMNVYNLGVCGETSYEIALRQGGIKMYINKQITIKSGKKTKIDIVDEYGNAVMLQNFNGYQTNNDESENIVYVNDYAYKLSYEKGAFYISMYDNNSSASVKLKKGTQVLTKAAYDMSGDAIIIQMGSNGGWDNYSELIAQYKRMIANSGAEYYIIVGDTDNPDESIEAQYYESSEEVGLNNTYWEAALEEEFGEHFLNMRTYMLSQAIETTGLAYSEDDIADISYGRVPESLKSDYTHLNSYGYYAMGVAIYEKGQQLGYWD